MKKKNEINTTYYHIVSPFSTTKIDQSRTITIINVGSYKVRVLIASFDHWEISILGYWEKRQSRLDSVNNEILNTSGITEAISEAIVIADGGNNFESDEVVINPFFSPQFFYSKKFAHKRNESDTPLSQQELTHIINHVHTLADWPIDHEIQQKLWIGTIDMLAIMKNISSITLDWVDVSSGSVLYGEDVTIWMIHSYIPKENVKMISDIVNFIWKSIIQIIPEEYALTYIDNDSAGCVYISVWNTTTLVSIKSDDDMFLWGEKIWVWMESLISQISKKSWKNRSEVIKKLNREDLFLNQKESFLEIFNQFLIEGMKEILGTRKCPSRFILVWGGSHNSFLEDSLLSFDFQKSWIKMNKRPELITPDQELFTDIEWVEKIMSMSTLPIIAQLMATGKFLEKNIII